MPESNKLNQTEDLTDLNLNPSRDIEKASSSSEHTRTDVDHAPTNISGKRNYMNDVDGGYAWVVVVGSFLVHFVVLGFMYSFGVFFRFYLQNDFKDKMDEFTGAFIGTLSNCILALMGLCSGPLTDKIGYRITLSIGCILFLLGQLLASFSTEVWHLFLTQGVLLGLGGSLAFFPAISSPSFWFQKNKGLALGFCVAGSGIGGLVWSPVIQALLDRVGFRWCLRACCLISAICMGIALLLIKVKPISAASPKKPIDFALVKDFKFLSLFWTGFISSFGFLVPFYLLPTYGAAKGISPSQSSILVGLINGGSALGRVILGSLADRVGRINMAFAGIFIAGVICLVCWIFANSFGVLIVFVLIYGFSSGAFISIFPALTSDIFNMYNIASVNGLLYMSTAIPNLVGTPVASAILSANTKDGVKNFIPVILYSGIAPLISCLGLLSLKYLVSKNFFAKS
ncbi:MFS general substrate transporter [Conidiobolus coronatus NRRL 28638]|uniref:MFS general substrate transporter n=1 Tax=Conidiobolus coronatus (strain ATCC 28846 / CBS 209.66 / NRRL 28638) TaxID=796925 RepID=A0A137PH66_CONC2|nr:MFS general substrate transporter [Conidiobolus coronatus NRRL 28638]|eukprot:KXN74347.1 MFS general substrate transporter [Conidiobolus coronatus NRRL 28638]